MSKLIPGKRKLPEGYRHSTVEEMRARIASGCSACDVCAQPKIPGSTWVADHSEVSLCEGCSSDTDNGHIVKDKPTKKPAPAKWTPIPVGTKLTKAALVEMANKLGAENAELRNKLAKGVG